MPNEHCTLNRLTDNAFRHVLKPRSPPAVCSVSGKVCIWVGVIRALGPDLSFGRRRQGADEVGGVTYFAVVVEADFSLSPVALSGRIYMLFLWLSIFLSFVACSKDHAVPLVLGVTARFLVSDQSRGKNSRKSCCIAYATFAGAHRQTYGRGATRAWWQQCRFFFLVAPNC